MENEIWKDIEGYEGIYQISDFGRVKSLARESFNPACGKITLQEKILKLTNQKGYFRITLRKEGVLKSYLVHRLVANAFLPKIKNKYVVNHINGNKSDSRVKNLEWCTMSENQHHAYKIGLKFFKGINRLEKLNEKQVYEIRNNYDGFTQKEIAKIYGVSRALIGLVKTRKIWKNI